MMLFISRGSYVFPESDLPALQPRERRQQGVHESGLWQAPCSPGPALRPDSDDYGWKDRFQRALVRRCRAWEGAVIDVGNDSPV